MRALVLTPGKPKSLRLANVRDPAPRSDELLVETLAIGICGTDRSLIEGVHAEAPEGSEDLIIGHESLGEVLQAPAGSGFHAGDRVVAIVRRPDPLPCPSCALGEWDMCQNGRFTERGIKGAHGYASDAFTLSPSFAVPVPKALQLSAVLLEPASIVAKAWEQIDYMKARLHGYQPSRVLVTGAGPIGLLAALFGVQGGHAVHVLDRVTDGPKPQLVAELGASYCTSFDQLREAPEVVIECTGADRVVLDAIASMARNGIVCLAGISSGKRVLCAKSTQLNNTLVLENEVVFGAVNANRRHYLAGLRALEQAPADWLRRVLRRRVPVERFGEAFHMQPHDVKVIVEWKRGAEAPHTV